MANYDDFYDNEYDYSPEEFPRDVKIDEVKEKLKQFFKENSQNVFYLKQLEVKFEKQFFHWITAKAINELIKEKEVKFEEVPLSESTTVKFVFNKSYRYCKRVIKKTLPVIKEYSKYRIANACGRQAEVLFLNAFMERNFLFIAKDVNEYGNKKWTKTNHNLDFIIEKNKVIYGCEVKNTFDYIDKEELDIKLEICDFLGIRPLFIMRSSPKSYNHEIIKKGGYTMIFEVRIFPFGQEELVERIKDVLDMPVDCPKSIPSGIIDRFVKWHNKQLSM